MALRFRLVKYDFIYPEKCCLVFPDTYDLSGFQLGHDVLARRYGRFPKLLGDDFEPGMHVALDPRSTGVLCNICGTTSMTSA